MEAVSPMLVIVIIAVIVIGYLIWSGSAGKSNNSGDLAAHGHPMAVPVETDTVPIPEEKNSAQVVLFFAPWCGHCKSVVPIWDQLMRKYKNVVKVDCDADKQVAQQESIQGFPTIRAYVNNNFVEYQGDRSPQSLEAFVMQYQ